MMRSYVHRSRMAMVVGVAIGIAHSAAAQFPVATNTPAGTEAYTRALLARPVTVNADHVSVSAMLDALAADAHVRIVYRTSVIRSVSKPVTLHVMQVPLGTALEHVLAGTGLQVVALTPSVLTIVPSLDGGVATEGVIVGTVQNAKTKQPIAGATVVLDDAARGVPTGSDGMFRLAAVLAGSHRVTVRMIGFVRQTKTVTVMDGESVHVDFVLEPGVTALDQVIVTGTIIPTELKAVPNAMTVITAKDLEKRGITHLDQLFRGDVPGVFAANYGSFSPLGQVTMYARGGTALNESNNASHPIKTYVDGVELADASYLSQIDPRSIERIEILTGPQASTIYGSGAINGVMQIFTKRGTTPRPQVTATLLSGTLQNNFSSAIAPQHDYSAQVSGTEGHWGYTVGGSWNYIGHWSPAIQQAITSGFGGSRLQLGHVTADASLRITTTTNRRHGAENQGVTSAQENGFYSTFGSAVGLTSLTQSTLVGQTTGLTLGYTPTSWWSHDVTLGTDAADVEQRDLKPYYRSKSDTTVSLSQSVNHKTTLRYATTVQAAMTSWSQLTLSAGADNWHNLTMSTRARGPALTGPIAQITRVTRQPGHNTGGFVQGQLAVNNALFLTYGLRAEWNPNYGTAAQPNYAPRYGVAYTHDLDTPLGNITAKLRGSYGRSTQPPTVGQKASITSDPFYATWYGAFDTQLANPDLGPESQQGGEGGLELYFGSRASFIVTRYNQTVDHLIVPTNVDSVASLTPNPSFCYNSIPDAAGYCYAIESQNLNVAGIRNQGWELQGTITLGPLVTNGTYSWTKSRVIGITERYRSLFDPLYYANYQPGAMFFNVPEHTWALGLTYGQGATSIRLNVNGVAPQWGGYATEFYFRNLDPSIRLDNNKANLSSYLYQGPLRRAYALADLNATRRLGSIIEGVVQIQNLTNYYQNDSYAQGAALGRQSKLGLRLRW